MISPILQPLPNAVNNLLVIMLLKILGFLSMMSRKSEKNMPLSYIFFSSCMANNVQEIFCYVNKYIFCIMRVKPYITQSAAGCVDLYEIPEADAFALGSCPWSYPLSSHWGFDHHGTHLVNRATRGYWAFTAHAAPFSYRFLFLNCVKFHLAYLFIGFASFALLESKNRLLKTGL